MARVSKGTGTEKAATPGFLIDIVSIGFNSAYAARRWYGWRLPEYGVWHGSARKRVAFFQVLDEELFQWEVSGRS